MKKKLVCLAVIFLLLPLFLMACRTTKISLIVRNDTGGCSGGPCTLLVRYKWVSGGNTTAPFGPRSLTITVPGNQDSPRVDYVEGTSNFQTQSSCHNLTGTVTFPPGAWIHRFYCGLDADGKTEILKQELIPAEE